MTMLGLLPKDGRGRRPQNLSGARFGRLVAVSPAGSQAGHLRWLCRCDCGREAVVAASQLRAGKTKSCGCLRIDKLREGKVVRPERSEYVIWLGMRQRCTNPRHHAYPRYGGRGIAICDRWATFENFLADMGRRPSPDHSLDRVDNDGPYAPSNCRWATRSQQARNSPRFAASRATKTEMSEDVVRLERENAQLRAENLALIAELRAARELVPVVENWHIPPRREQPAFNHTRADGPFDPCPECLPLMSREQLIALVRDMFDVANDRD